MALACPHTFTFSYAFDVAFMGGTVSSFSTMSGNAHDNDEDDDEDDKNNNNNNNNNNTHNKNEHRSISVSARQTLTHVLLLLPTLMHLVIHRNLFPHPGHTRYIFHPIPRQRLTNRTYWSGCLERAVGTD